ncbi:MULTISPECIES: DUF6318 family protein [Arthrobacter]|uniref:DUF6318 domain-containing protein n=1 Tax=Arthrobacter terricola TaxID=2547396 RepID=A0A4R5KVP4_9MICC|nr:MULTISPECIES: DUF6318 family protein [Arthrobacter]MBT8159856.1 hypothetical protein [Arthrobacter sp. GN70]TDF99057.1 hypothetical protein E1809_05635 [Arthrobacter terricola]
MISRTSTSFRARSFAIAVVGVMFGLTGCALDGSLGASGDPSVSVTATPTPTATAVYRLADATGKAQNVRIPMLPEEANANSEDGVEAFARYWFQTLSYAYETGDVTAWSANMSPHCKFCTRLKEGLDSAYSNGRWLVGGKILTPSIESKYKPEAPTQQVVIKVVQDKIDVLEADGSISQPTTSASKSESVMIASFESGLWKVKDLGLIR